MLLYHTPSVVTNLSSEHFRLPPLFYRALQPSEEGSSHGLRLCVIGFFWRTYGHTRAFEVRQEQQRYNSWTGAEGAFFYPSVLEEKQIDIRICESFLWPSTCRVRRVERHDGADGGTIVDTHCRVHHCFRSKLLGTQADVGRVWLCLAE